MLSVHAVHPCNQSIAKALVCIDIKYYTSVLEIPSHDDFHLQAFPIYVYTKISSGHSGGGLGISSSFDIVGYASLRLVDRGFAM